MESRESLLEERSSVHLTLAQMSTLVESEIQFSAEMEPYSKQGADTAVEA